MRKVFLLLFLVLYTFGCKEKASEVQPEKDLILASNTKVLTSEQRNMLATVNTGQVIFNGNIADYKNGDIVVSDIADKAPNGFLRKVMSIQQSGGQTILNTEEATVTDAIEKAETSYSKSFEASDIVLKDTSGVEIFSKPSRKDKNGTLSFNFSKVVYDKDNNSNTKYDRVEVEGSLELSPTFVFDMKIQNYQIKKFLFKVGANQKANIKAKWGVGINASNYVPKQFVLATYQLPAFTIPIGGFPIPVAKNWIVILCGIDGSISVELSAETKNEYKCEAGMLYENNQWSYIGSQTNAFTIPSLQAEGTAKIEPWIEARYEARPFGLPTSRLSLGVRGSLEANATANLNELSYELNWRAKMSAKAQMQVFSSAVVNAEYTFFDVKYPIKNGSLPLATNVALNKTATASASASGAPPSSAFDGNNTTAWNSRSYSANITVDLAQARTVSKLILNPSQSPAGTTTHQIWVSPDMVNWKIVDISTQFTTNGVPFERKLSVPETNVRGVRVVTTSSPSWVAWFEIAVMGW